MTAELIIPPAVKKDVSAREIMRGWVSKQGLSLNIRADTWPDAGMWGIALADIARHVADGIYKQSKVSVDSSLDEVKQELFKALKDRGLLEKNGIPPLTAKKGLIERIFS